MNEQNSRVLKKPKNLNGRVLEKNPKSYLQKKSVFCIQSAQRYCKTHIILSLNNLKKNKINSNRFPENFKNKKKPVFGKSLLYNNLKQASVTPVLRVKLCQHFDFTYPKRCL